MKKLNKLFTALMVVAIFTGLSSCKKVVEVAQVEQATGLIQMAPGYGTAGTVINISGNNFPATSDISVTLNGKTLPIKVTTNNQIQVTVPNKTGSGEVMVSFGGKTYDAGHFEYVYTHFSLKTISNGLFGYLDGPLATAEFDGMTGLAIDANDNLFVGYGNPYYNNPPRIRKVNLTGSVVSTLAGSGTSGDVNAQGTAAAFGQVRQLSATKNGNLYILDRTNLKIKKIDPAGNVTTVVTLPYRPEGIKVVESGNIYVTGAYTSGPNNGLSTIEKYSNSGTKAWSVMSHGNVYASVDGDSSVAKFVTRNGIEVDSAETTLYFAHLIVSTNYATQIKALDLSTLTISNFAGSAANTGAATVDGDAASAGLNWITSMVLDENGGLYFADYFGLVRYINHGIVSTIVDNSDGLVGAWGIARDSKGNIIFSDFDTNELKYITRDY